ncbi:MAG: ATP-binding protein [Gammaproteobacteria bacterium]
MIERLQVLTAQHHLFLMGPRGVGKSTLLKKMFNKSKCLWIDLLEATTEQRFAANPDELANIVRQLDDSITHVVIDEVQKIPKLLDVVHMLIEEKKKIFILSGSSARKLRRGAANLLAGRAFVYYLYPFSFLELNDDIDVNALLQYGTLPQVFTFLKAQEKQQYLMSYAQTYLKEEIIAEQVIRNLDPFRRFLELSAQCNGKIINYSAVARDVGASETTVKEYFQILEDTLVGFFLEPFRHSFRKRLSLKPKFYYFDTGVVRALGRMLSAPIQRGTSYYGELFEHYVIIECLRLANYYYPEYRFSYAKTKDGAEIDLVVERPGLPHLFIEIKSTDNVRIEKLKSFIGLVNDYKDCEAICLSQDPYAKQLGPITVYPWKEGIKRYFALTDSNGK